MTCTASATRFRGDYKVGPRISGTREVTAEGYWERQDGRTWKPFKGGTVKVAYQPAEPGSAASFEGTTTTRADGHFALTFTATADGEEQRGPCDPGRGRE
ncbi:hypothetical protein [Streptomyces sp. NBC_01176]|uniref:hypothetical protein n=1 Tax=Streptomyces sp. NBC_01176 TaxID=2903760 RepID=UPI00386401A8|nr:hypothetical protein OG199_41950 [Streptomyces sp. NBC_01176]